jgi:polysaccharide export outer membrane protein
MPVQAEQGGGQGRPAILTSFEITPEGRLVRLTFRTSSPVERFSLSRQGPPDQRDLVLHLRNTSSALSMPPTASSGGDSLVPFSAESGSADGKPLVRVVIHNLGDSLVRFDEGDLGFSILLIPPDKARTKATGAYRVGTDDVLAVSVFSHEDLTKTTKVSPDGLINFPLIGNVRAAGRTVGEISAEIQERLGEDFLVEPHVTVSVWEYLSQWVNVIGEVSKPGRYYMTGPTTLVDAISMAGGLKPSAGDAILVTRRSHESDPAAAGQQIQFSTSSMMGQEAAAASFRLRPGDVVNVPVPEGETKSSEGSAERPE